MSTPPMVLGRVVEPTRIIDPQTASVAQVAEVLKHVVTRDGIYHTESDQNAALEAIDAFKSAFSNGAPDVREDHMAPREDVSKRIPPNVGRVPIPAAMPALDYDQLARAIMRVQQEGNS